MNDFDRMLHFLNRPGGDHMFPGDTLLNELFSEEESCPYGEAVFYSIEEHITSYRETVTGQEIPGEVSARLRTVIKKRWSLEVEGRPEEGR